MSEIGLSGFIGYRQNAQGDFAFLPEPRRVRQGKRPTVTLGSMPFPDDIEVPKEGLTMYFGFSYAREEVGRQMRAAAEEGFRIEPLACKMEVGKVVLGVTHMEDLANLKFLNLKRASSEVIDYIKVECNKEIDRRMKNAGRKRYAYMEHSQDIGLQPDVLCTVMSKGRFSNLRAIAYQVQVENTVRQYVTVFSGDVKIATQTKHLPFELVLPDLG
jgi:hypothetical protein